MSNYEDAKTLARTIVETANGAGTKTSALLTDMNSVLGTTVGNALEVEETLDYLKNRKCYKKVDIITKALAAELLVNAKILPDTKTAEAKIEEKIISAQDKIIKLETEIYVTLRQEIATYSNYILNLSAMIAELDIFLSFADNAIRYNYCCPKVSNTKNLILKDARHPVVEQILKSGNFVANDINLNDTTDRVMIITGPNMSGKSTYLRQTALIVIMAQIGSFVPCSSAEIGVVDRIFTRIGAGDNLAGGESTFTMVVEDYLRILPFM